MPGSEDESIEIDIDDHTPSTAATKGSVARPSAGLWNAICKSVAGASHLRANTPNQDATAVAVRDGTMVVTVADGHGSAKSFRSDVGARLVVATTNKVALDWLDAQRASRPPLAVIKDAAVRELPLKIEKLWKRTIDAYTDAHPFTPDELDKLEKAAGRSARDALSTSAGRHLAYGSTLLAACITNEFVIFLQLGDGDILVVSDTASGDVSRPVPRDETLIANETTSLCQDKAWQKFRVRFLHLHASAPALVLLSTDGYANSFKSDLDFLKVGSDLLAILRREGPDVVQRECIHGCKALLLPAAATT